MLKVIKYIEEYGLDKLISSYGLVANWSIKYPNLVQLCYHQLDTPKNEITNECRGLILDTSDNFKVISYPFYRFSDYSDRSVLDTESLKFYEKLDGSVISLYHYKGEWNISTKTLPDAQGKIFNKEIIFHDYFFQTFEKLGYALPTDINKTYVFEFMYSGQGIVNKKTERISLLMVRDLTTFEEKNHIEIGEALGWEFSLPENIPSLEVALDIVKNLDPIKCEGFVVVDRNFTRYKIKSPQFEKISALKTNWDGSEERQRLIEKDNFRKLCEIVRTNNHSTFISLDKYKTVYNQWKKVKNSYKKLLNDTENFVVRIEGLEGKELGIKMKNSEKYLNSLAFGISQKRIIKDKEGYLEEYFYNMNIKTFEEIIRKLK